MNSATKKNTRDVGMTCPSAKLARAVQMQDSLNPGLHPKEMDKKTQDFLYEKKTKKSNRQRHPQEFPVVQKRITVQKEEMFTGSKQWSTLSGDEMSPSAFTLTGDSRGEVVIPYWLSRGRAKRAIGAEFQVRHLLNFYTSNV
ncbi:UNVERIFIED_CONTAM: hypothetical protein FKN15_064822 [Acipenser sinensis]